MNLEMTTAATSHHRFCMGPIEKKRKETKINYGSKWGRETNGLRFILNFFSLYFTTFYNNSLLLFILNFVFYSPLQTWIKINRNMILFLLGHKRLLMFLLSLLLKNNAIRKNHFSFSSALSLIFFVHLISFLSLSFFFFSLSLLRKSWGNCL